MFYQLLPNTSVGNEKGKQVRIQILILGYTELRKSKTHFNQYCYIVLLLL